MAARKLQSEVDRTLKKVAEGVEIFDGIYDKMQASTNQTQKEKLESDLKTQIKKLQRLRDQIKSWVTNNDIKDKTQLVDNRKLIETQMEKFKACEKEMKTKAFSKGGLIAALKQDPKEKEKAETSTWLTSQVDELSRQIESSEAEAESLQGGLKKRGKGSPSSSRLEELEALNERRKWHISRLEIILRLLENGALTTDKVLELKEDISYFVESNTEEDFDEDVGIYDELNLDAEEANFRVGGEEASDDEESDAEESAPSRSPQKDPPKHKISTREDSSLTPRKDDHSPVLRKATVPVRKATLESSKPPSIPPTANFAATPMSEALKANLPPSGAPGTAGSKPALPPIRYAAAVANSHPNGPAGLPSPSVSKASNGQLNGTPGTAAPPSASSFPVLSTPALSSAASVSAQENNVPPSPSITSSPIASSAAPPSLMSRLTPPPGSSGYFDSRQQSPALSMRAADIASITSPRTSISAASPLPNDTASQSSKSASAPQPSVPSTIQTTPASEPASQPPGLSSQLSPLPHQVQQESQQQQNSTALPVESSTVSRKSSPAPPARQEQSRQSQPQYPPGMLPVASQQLQEASAQQQQPSQQNVPQPALRAQPPQQRPAALPSSLADLVASFESAKQKAPTRMANLNQVQKVLESGFGSMPQPRDTEKPKYYVPRNPYTTAAYYPQHPLVSMDTSALYARLEPETLFYIFYYHAGTYQQHLAAQELKRQSWRFHVKYLTWFQRHSEPQLITDEYEQGVYVYFDWEGSWCQRKKSDFRFEYRYLSED